MSQKVDWKKRTFVTVWTIIVIALFPAILVWLGEVPGQYYDEMFLAFVMGTCALDLGVGRRMEGKELE